MLETVNISADVSDSIYKNQIPLGKMSCNSNSILYVLISGSKLVLPLKGDGKTC